MPPKAARGAARGRGRGRGRGRPAASASADTTTAAGPSIENGTANETSDEPMLDEPAVPMAKMTTPQHLLDDTSAPSPNSSPVSIPTETPAPTPARVPIPRSEPAAVPSSSSSGPSTRGGRGGARGAKPATTSRFKPKNVRSDASKLEEIRLKEQEKLDAIARQKREEQNKLLRGRGRPARGRGDVMGRRAGTASGVLSIAPEALKSNPDFVSKSFGGGGGGGGGGFGVKREIGRGGSGGGRGTPGDPSYEPAYPDQDEDTERVDIETINIVSDDEEPVITAVRKIPYNSSRGGGGAGLKPVRLHRVEHKERVTMVNTEPNIKPDPDDDEPMVDEVRSVRPARRGGRGALPEDGFIKYEIDDDSNMAMDMRARSMPPPSPDSKRKLRKGSNANSSAMDLDSIPRAEPATKEKKARKRKVVDRKPVLQTAEDMAEYERHMQDVAILAEELGGMQTNLRQQEPKLDADGNIDMTDVPAAEPEDPKAGRLYLLQFPPVLPELYNPAHPKPKTPFEIRAEELEAEEARKEAEAAAKNPKLNKGKTPQNLDPKIKHEHGEKTEPLITPEERRRQDEEDKKARRQGFVKEEGYIGKMIVRKNGRAELTWGGTNLLVGRGIATSFLSTGVIVDGQERGPPGGGAPEGKAVSMGQIMGKFVVTPDWEKLG